MNDDLNPQYLLDWAASIGKAHPFIDFHVHPFDVFTGDTQYQPDPSISGRYIKRSQVYKPPIVVNNVESTSERDQLVTENPRALLLVSRLIYSQTGPKVFTDQLDIAGIERALLLPVVPYGSGNGLVLKKTEKIFLNNDRFLAACPFPAGTSHNLLIDYYKKCKANQKIVAIKIHPNLNGLDPLSETGKELIETSLIAAKILHLPVVVHGGITSGLPSPDARVFGTLDRLKNIDWSTTASPIVIAHAGCYGLSEEEVKSSLPILDRLMAANHHLMADISALNQPALRLVLAKVDRQRLLFGSDALYFTIWKAWVRFLHALRSVSPNPDEDLIRIASQNPLQCVNYSAIDRPKPIGNNKAIL